MLTCDHFSDGRSPHHFAETDRRHVALYIVQPAAHRRLEREVEIANQKLARVWGAYGNLDAFKVVFFDHAGRALTQDPLAVRRGDV